MLIRSLIAVVLTLALAVTGHWPAAADESSGFSDVTIEYIGVEDDGDLVVRVSWVWTGPEVSGFQLMVSLGGLHDRYYPGPEATAQVVTVAPLMYNSIAGLWAIDGHHYLGSHSISHSMPHAPQAVDAGDWQVRYDGGSLVAYYQDQPATDLSPIGANGVRLTVEGTATDDHRAPFPCDSTGTTVEVTVTPYTRVPIVDGPDHFLITDSATFEVEVPACPLPPSGPDTDDDGGDDQPVVARVLPVPPAEANEPTPQGAIHRLYLGLFGRIADEGGMDHWVDRYQQGQSSALVVRAMIATDEGQAYFGLTSPDQPATLDLLDFVYRHLMGREPDAEGWAYWANLIENGYISAATLIASFVLSAEMAQLIAAAFGP